MSIITILDEIGENGPLILMIISIFLLWSRQNQLIYCIIGTFANSLLNVFLKGFFQQPRPSVDIDSKIFKLALKNGKGTIFKNGMPYNIFGMPSGHAQLCLFYTVFVFMCLRQYNILIVYLLISLLTVHQRVKHSHHTILQVFAGGIVGTFVGYALYILTNNNIKGCIKKKPDDNARIY
jgi:membrane-associated phospholipid phosphatase